jgi:hypothetical protein
MANKNFDPNARYDNGPNCAGAGRVTYPTDTTAPTGVASDGVVANSNVFCGYNCAGGNRNNPGPNTSGEQRSYNNT